MDNRHFRRILLRVGAALLFFAIATGFNTCGEGHLPPPAPPNPGVVNIFGEAV